MSIPGDRLSRPQIEFINIHARSIQLGQPQLGEAVLKDLAVCLDLPNRKLKKML